MPEVIVYPKGMTYFPRHRAASIPDAVSHPAPAKSHRKAGPVA